MFKNNQLPRCIVSLLFSVLLITRVLASDEALIIPEVNLAPSKKSLLTKQDAEVQTSHIERKQLAESTVTDLTALLKQQQSIARLTNISGDSTQVAVSIRGFGDNAVANSLVLIDGFSLINPSLLTPNLNLLDLSDIEKVDIFQGSEGVLWGDGAVGGVVNIITRHPEKNMAEANLGYGSYNKKFLSFLLGDKYDNGIFYKISGFGNSTDNYRQHNQQQDAGIISQFGMDYARGTISVNLQAYDDDVNFPGGLTQAQYDTNPRQASDNINFIHYHTQIYQLLNKHELSDNWILETRLSHRDIAADGFMYSNFNREEWINSIDPRLSGTVDNTKVMLGYDGIASSYQFTNNISDNHVTANQNDLYARAVMPLLEHLEFTLGGREARQDNDISQLHGQAVTRDQVFVSEQGLSYYPMPSWQLFLRRAGNFSFPRTNQETWLPPTQTTLLPQTGVSYEMGSQWGTARYKTQLSIYQLILNNEIAFDPNQTPTAPFGSYSNLPKTLRDGITLTEFYRINPKTTLESQLNYVDARFDEGQYAGNSIPAVPAFNGNFGIDYQFAPHWRSQYTAIYNGSSYPSNDNANIGNKLAGYWLQNIALQYWHQSVKIGFEVQNIFNQKYSLYTAFNTAAHTNIYYPAAGRNYLLTVRASLD